jgi:hypothetical protein
LRRSERGDERGERKEKRARGTQRSRVSETADEKRLENLRWAEMLLR